MQNLNIIDEINQAKSRLKCPEQIGGKGLMMPFNPSNSGSRKIMQSTMVEHMIALNNPEVPLIQTGYENKLGEYTSSLLISNNDYDVIHKIIKFTNDHYYLIIRNINGEYDILERIQYEHLTETHGYLYNNDYIDQLKQGSIIHKGDTIKKSLAYDEYNNRQDGVNLLSTYMSDEFTKEDSIIISQTASRKLTSPLIKKIQVIINDNDILLNIYGNDELYKSFPNIGEDINNGILCALRREKIEECLFSQSSNRLKHIMMSDEKFTVEGKIIDLNIYCNNPTILNENHFLQLKFYYEKNVEFVKDFIDKVGPIIESGYQCSYNLQKMYYMCKQSSQDAQYIKDNKPFSNTIIEFIILENKPVNIGDKMSNRYGGKGVVSLILPDDRMPKLDDGQILDVIWNSSTCINRENMGQLFETEINNISARIIEYFNLGILSFDEMVDMYIKFITLIDEEEGNVVKQYLDDMDEDQKMTFIEFVCSDNGILISSKPLSNTMSIDKLNILYKEFPFAKQYDLYVAIEDSNMNTKFIKTRRPLTCGRQYIYRLKQYAEEKFSVVSLSATNIKGENSRDSSKKNYKSIHSRTPIKFGEMETGNLAHLGIENVIVNLMIHSSSPQGRRLAKELLTGDPFDPNIVLDEDSKNRTVEILNAYLLTMGLRIVIEKYPIKLKKAILRRVLKRENKRYLKPIINRINKNEVFNTDEYIERTVQSVKRIIRRKPIKRN